MEDRTANAGNLEDEHMFSTGSLKRVAFDAKDRLARTRARIETAVWPVLAPTVASLLCVSLASAFVPEAGDGKSSRIAIDAVPVASRVQGSGMAGSTVAGAAGAEQSARALARRFGVALGADDWPRHVASLGQESPGQCPASDLVVSWVRPGPGFQVGAHVEPVGPVPTASTTRVNGIVVCRGSQYSYLGFEASYEFGRWWLTPVPALEHEDTTPELLPGEAAASGASPTPAAGENDPASATSDALPLRAEWESLPLDELAPHVPQATCDPVAKPGVLGFRDLLLDAYPGTRNLGIGRLCESPGFSEHKEGRGFDWGVRVDVPEERAAAEAVLAWLLDGDAQGRPFAMARRVGVMYIIWNGQIWSAERAVEGWRSYVGVSEHRDHVHFSFSWAGARGQTSFWTGELRRRLHSATPDLPLVRPGATIPITRAADLAPAPATGATTSTTQPHAGGGGAGTSGGGTDAGTSSDAPTTTSPPPAATTSTTTTTTTTTAPPVITTPTSVVVPLGGGLTP